MICGRYAENAAFNPSLPAMQTAINFAYLNQLDVSKIERVVFAEKPLRFKSPQDGRAVIEESLQGENGIY